MAGGMQGRIRQYSEKQGMRSFDGWGLWDSGDGNGDDKVWLEMRGRKGVVCCVEWVKRSPGGRPCVVAEDG